MREIRTGGPTITKKGKRLVEQALREGRISEGKLTRQFEDELARFLKVPEVVATNSGNSALLLSFLAAKYIHGRERVVTTSLTFAATVSAALNVGMRVECMDVAEGGFLIDPEQARTRIELAPLETVYVPVHLFGYPCPRFRHDAFEVQDACEALGTRVDCVPIGIPDLGCFSFYTSHVAGCGELGAISVRHKEDADYIRSMKDQGRSIIRSVSHVEKMTPAPFLGRYSHARCGWNFRTTDLQAALALGALSELPSIIERRREVVGWLNDAVAPYVPVIKGPPSERDISHMVYPILCDKQVVRDALVDDLEREGIETRPLLSVIPDEGAFKGAVDVPYGQKNARDAHRKGLYISCHESMTKAAILRIRKVFQKSIG